MTGSIRTWCYDRAGPAREVMRQERIACPQPGAGEVLVEVKVCAVNPTDIKRRTGGRELGRFEKIIANNDGAGIITAAGDGVERKRIGEHVWLFGAQAGRPHGTASDALCIASSQAIALPDSASFTDGACLGVPAVTAWHGVLGGGPVAGKTVLVTGAGGRVGRYAVQVARHAGARVVATSRAEKAEELALLGADAVVDYRADDMVDALRDAAPDGIDRVADGALATTLKHGLPCLRSRAVIAAYASDMDGSPVLPFASLLYANITLEAFSVFGLASARQAAAIEGVSRLLAEGCLQHRVGARFTFDEMIEAHEAVEAGDVDGACLVTTR